MAVDPPNTGWVLHNANMVPFGYASGYTPAAYDCRVGLDACLRGPTGGDMRRVFADEAARRPKKRVNEGMHQGMRRISIANPYFQ